MKKLLLVFLLIQICFPSFCQSNKEQKLSFEYPFKQGSAKWKAYKTASDRIAALQIPKEILGKLTTDELIDICLDYPYLSDMFAYSNFDMGFKQMCAKFNGFGELLGREDIAEVLLTRYEKIPQVGVLWTKRGNEEKGFFSLRIFIITYLLGSENVYKCMNNNQLQRLTSSTDNNLKKMGNDTELYGTMGLGAIKRMHESIRQLNRQLDYSEGDIFYGGNGNYRVRIKQTPNASSVISGQLLTPDLSTAEKEYYRFLAENNYGAVFVSEATLQYNCHAYAWHISQGHPEDLVWIGFANDSITSKQRENIYWEDGSYIEVPEAIATHISYDEMSADHSALKYDSTRYISKWGSWPLVIHLPNEVPYNTSQPKKFYHIAPKISGSSSLCDTHDYSIDNLPTGADVSWALSVNGSSTAAQLSVNTPAVNQCRITRSSSQSGSFSATLTATITYQNDTIKVLSKSLDGPAHFVSVLYTIINTVGSGGTGGMVGSYNNIEIKPNTTYYLFSPYFVGKRLIALHDSPIVGNYMFSRAAENAFYVMVPQDGNMIAQLSDGCTTTTWSFWGHSYAYNMSISGGNGLLTVEITQGDSSSSENRGAGTQQKVPASKELPAWTLEVYEATTFKKMSSAEVNGNSHILDTSSWPKGIYIVRTIVDKEILSEKITIQ